LFFSVQSGRLHWIPIGFSQAQPTAAPLAASWSGENAKWIQHPPAMGANAIEWSMVDSTLGRHLDSPKKWLIDDLSHRAPLLKTERAPSAVVTKQMIGKHGPKRQQSQKPQIATVRSAFQSMDPFFTLIRNAVERVALSSKAVASSSYGFGGRCDDRAVRIRQIRKHTPYKVCHAHGVLVSQSGDVARQTLD
jgi:hypothetical protein